MTFVRIGKSSFVIDNLNAVMKGVGSLLAIILFFVVILTGIIFYYEYILGIQPNRDEGDIVFTDWLLIAMPIAIACVVSLFCLPRYLYSKLSEQEKKFQMVSNIISKKNFTLDELRNFTDTKRTIYYSNINSVYIDEIENNKFHEENSIGYLIFELNNNIKNWNFDKQNKNDRLFNKIKVYNIPVGGDISECKEIINNFMPQKIRGNQHVSSLGYTVRKQRSLNLILQLLLVIGSIGWGLTASILYDQKLYNDLILLTVATAGIVLLFLYVYLGKYWYKPHYFQYWSEKKTRWNARHFNKLLIIFIIGVVIAMLYLFSIKEILSVIYNISPESIFEKKQVIESPYDYLYDQERNDMIKAGYESFKQNNSIK